MAVTPTGVYAQDGSLESRPFVASGSDTQQQTQPPLIFIIPCITIIPPTPNSSPRITQKVLHQGSLPLYSFLQIPTGSFQHPRFQSSQLEQGPGQEEEEYEDCKYLRHAYHKYVSSDWTGFKTWLPLAKRVRAYLHEHKEITPVWRKIFCKLSDCLDEDYMDDEAISSFLAELELETTKINDKVSDLNENTDLLRCKMERVLKTCPAVEDSRLSSANPHDTGYVLLSPKAS